MWNDEIISDESRVSIRSRTQIPDQVLKPWRMETDTKVSAKYL